MRNLSYKYNYNCITLYFQGLAIGSQPTSMSRKPKESLNEYFDRIYITPLVDWSMFWTSPEEYSTWEKQYWTTNIFGRRFYIRKLFFSILTLVIFSKVFAYILLPEQVR